MSGSYIEVTDQSFQDDVVGAEAPVIVDFWAPWCGPCLAMAPTFEDMAEKYKGKVTFAKLNTDDNPKTPGRLGIQGIPTMIVFKSGKEVDRIVGAMRREVFQKRLEAVFGVASA